MRLMQHLVVPTFVIDPQRRVVIWNRACERLTGVAASEVLGTSLHWRAFYEKRRYCLADLVALGRQDQSGDECLRTVAAVIGENALRPVDLAARYGGEASAIIMPGTGPEGACRVADFAKLHPRRTGAKGPARAAKR